MNSLDLVHKLGKLFDLVEPETPEEVIRELLDAGLDPEQVGQRIEEAVREAQKARVE